MPDTSTEQTRPTVRAWLKSAAYAAGNFFIRYPLATAATVLILTVVLIFGVFGIRFDVLALDGLLGRLWGRKDPSGPPVSPPPGRVDGEGKPIPPGVPDDLGYVQVPSVRPISDPGVFSNPGSVTVPGSNGDETIALPKGVKNEDVKEVLVVSPEVKEAANRDKPTVDTKKLLEDLDK